MKWNGLEILKKYFISIHTAVNSNVLIACNISLTIGGDSLSDIVCILPLISIAGILSRGPEAVKVMKVGRRTCRKDKGTWNGE